MTITWCMVFDISSMTGRLFCHFRQFLPFCPSNNPQNQNFEKLKKNTWRYYHLNMCTINENCVCGSWDMEHEKQDFLQHFWLFYPTNNPKNEKKPKNIIILHKWTKNHDQMLYCSWDMVCDGCNFNFSF